VEIELFGSGISQGSYDFPLVKGQAVDVEKVTAAPGEAVEFAEGSTLVAVTAGSVSHYPDCTMKETWSAGNTYFHSTAGHPGAITVNEGSEPAILVLVHSGATAATPAASGGGHHDHGGGHGSGPAPMGGGHEGHGGGSNMVEVSSCPGQTEAAAADPKGNTIAWSADALYQQFEKMQLQIWRFKIEPGYTTDWHTHPDAVIALQADGVLENWNGCTEKEVWDPGYSYFHSPGTHGRHQNMTTNRSDAPGTVIGVFFNIPAEYGNALPPVIKSPPPAECPTSVLTY
jgi:quercetin dioxygenase-like cupin family protein